MSRTRVIRFGVTGILALGAVAVGADDSRSTGPKSEAESLRKALAEEVARNQLLEKKIKDLQYQVKELQLRQAAETRTFPEAQRVPDDWRPYQFNGMTVYIVPLGTGQARITAGPK